MAICSQINLVKQIMYNHAKQSNVGFWNLLLIHFPIQYLQELQLLILAGTGTEFQLNAQLLLYYPINWSISFYLSNRRQNVHKNLL